MKSFNYYPALILKYFNLIQSSVPPKFIKKPEDKIASESQDLEFECEIYGKPEPKITWLKNGERITLSAYWQIVNGYMFRKSFFVFHRNSVKLRFNKLFLNSQYFHFRYNLRINGLLPIDAGIFQCMGVNPAGSVQASARLTINQPSEFHEMKYRNLFSNAYTFPFVNFFKDLLMFFKYC